MTENDKQILKHWRKVMADQDAGDGRIVHGYWDATEGLDKITDPELRVIIARYRQPVPDVYATDPIYAAALEQFIKARDLLKVIADGIDSTSSVSN